jgi:hypothetical protein
MTERSGTGVTPASSVLNYLRDRYLWETQAQELFERSVDTGKVAAALELIGESRRRFLAKHVAPSVDLSHSPAFGDPPSVDPDSARIIATRETGQGRMIVVTMELGSGPEPVQFEYELELIEGSWRLRDRRARTGPGDLIRGLL